MEGAHRTNQGGEEVQGGGEEPEKSQPESLDRSYLSVLIKFVMLVLFLLVAAVSLFPDDVYLLSPY